MAPEGSGALDIFVSGRLCLFGEHSDWAGGYRTHNPDILPGKTIVVGTQEGLYARASRHDGKVLRVTATSHSGEVHGPREFVLDEEALLAEAQKGGFWSYVAGTAYRILVAHEVSGLILDNHRTTLPMSKGLSSSAAICVMVARAFNRVYNLKLTTRGEMELAYMGEVTTPSKCGRMDQACAYGSVPVVMTFDGDLTHITRVPLQGDLHLVLVDLKASKDTTTILRNLQAAYPRAQDEAQERLHQLLGEVNHGIVARALKAIGSGDVQALGALMREAQVEFDQKAGPLCPSQLAAPVLHRVLELPGIQALICGGKGVGSQGDGAAQLLCKGREAQQRVCEVLESELGVVCMPLTVSSKSGLFQTGTS